MSRLMHSAGLASHSSFLLWRPIEAAADVQVLEYPNLCATFGCTFPAPGCVSTCGVNQWMGNHSYSQFISLPFNYILKIIVARKLFFCSHWIQANLGLDFYLLN